MCKSTLNETVQTAMQQRSGTVRVERGWESGRSYRGLLALPEQEDMHRIAEYLKTYLNDEEENRSNSMKRGRNKQQATA
jgi:rhamnogalacturonyl hydrolase YesR